jgi:hypothetical protein
MKTNTDPRPHSDTPETDEQIGCGYEVEGKVRLVQLVQPDFARRLERERNKALELLASEESTRNTIIAKGIETERQLAEAREAFVIATDQLVQVQGKLRQARKENARLREALIDARKHILEQNGLCRDSDRKQAVKINSPLNHTTP